MSSVNSLPFRTAQPTPESLPPSGNVLRLKQAEGLPTHIHPLNPLQFLLRAALTYPDKLALIHPDSVPPTAYTYAVWAQRAQNLAYALIQSGIAPGDRVAVIAPNSPMAADVWYGVIAARAVVTAINYRLTVPEVSYILHHSGAKLILVDYQFIHLVKDANVPIVVCNDTGSAGDPYEEYLKGGRRFSRERGWLGLDVEADENIGSTLCYTSGTTARPKGVITTLRGSYLAGIANAFEAQVHRDSIFLWVLPMFHAGGWTFPYGNVFSFATQVTMRNVDSSRIWKHLINLGVTHYGAAPTVQIGIVNDPLARKLPQKVTTIVAGSAPTAVLIAKLEEIGIKSVHVYGLTETYGPFTRCYDHPSWSDLPFDERAKLMARQGKSFATALEVRVVHVKGEDRRQAEEPIDVPWDGKTVGEIVTRGNILMKEYFRDPEATHKAFAGGYFHTGDLAVMDPDGSIKIVDRIKDLIISGGENASSIAIEQALASHPHVLEVSVVARPHPKWGERPMAFVILHPDHKTKWVDNQDAFAVDLKAHGRKVLPGFACPEWVLVVDELPKTSTGKILKTNLRKMVAKL